MMSKRTSKSKSFSVTYKVLNKVKSSDDIVVFIDKETIGTDKESLKSTKSLKGNFKWKFLELITFSTELDVSLIAKLIEYF